MLFIAFMLHSQVISVPLLLAFSKGLYKGKSQVLPRSLLEPLNQTYELK